MGSSLPAEAAWRGNRKDEHTLLLTDVLRCCLSFGDPSRAPERGLEKIAPWVSVQG